MTTQPEPLWLTHARTYIGTKELAGAGTSPVIAGWLTRLRSSWRDDETPWCGTFVAGVFTCFEIAPADQWYRARAWLNWGVPLEAPRAGCVVVFERGPAAGHVGFVVGEDSRGNVLTLGGNQGDAVSIASFPRRRVLGFRWPTGEPMPETLPTLDAVSPSTSEA